MKWLVTGGAGYIGSHVILELLNGDNEVVAIDSLASGSRERIPNQVKFFDYDIRDITKIEKILKAENFDGIFHLAALKSVNQSFQQSKLYMEVNTEASVSLFKLACRENVKKIIFSSTAAVYSSEGENSKLESDVPNPSSPYGNSKLLAEYELDRLIEENMIEGTSLRFFNVIGSAGGHYREINGENLLPKIVNQLRSGIRPQIYGKDYETRDGTCIRDYVDVRDIAKAHVSAAFSQKIPNKINIGTGIGSTVLEVVSEISQVLGKKCDPDFQDRRLGDQEVVIADISLARNFLNYAPNFLMHESVATSIL